MANNMPRILALMCALLYVFPMQTNAQKNGCGQRCKTLNDCPGQLICTAGKCTDDPDVGTNICSNTGGGSTGTCKPNGRLQGRTPPSKYPCNTDNGAECCSPFKTYVTYDCSPAVSTATPAILTLNDFSEGGDGGGASSCDEKFHPNSERVVALSSGWFDGRSRCLKMIRVSANGRRVLAKVVDECDSRNGCDDAHGYQPPCRNNVVDASEAVWNALGVSKDQQGELNVTWSLA